jgi:hypothetical protein
LMSYPHWPPSCYEEALDQLRCIVGQDVNHRGYLAHCWKSWLCQKAYLDKTLSREKQDFYRNSVTLVIAECPKLSEWDADSQSSYQKPTTCLRYCGKNFCEQECLPALGNGPPKCLCVCRWHREECPFHKVP